jgi:DNA polymerase III delta prime subunit
LFTLFTELTFLLETTRIDDLRHVYRDFIGIYERHVDDAKFEVIKGHEFKSLKERLITVRHLLQKHPEAGPGKRTELIHAVLSEDNLRRAQQIFPKSDKNNQSGKTLSLLSTITGFFAGSKETDEESLRTEVKKKTSSVSDSDFLLQLKGVDDKDLEAAIQVAVDLACNQLSSSIDTAVKKMTHAVLRMQEDECKKSMQREIETEERKELSGRLADFIHTINEVSARRRTS